MDVLRGSRRRPFSRVCRHRRILGKRDGTSKFFSGCSCFFFSSCVSCFSTSCFLFLQVWRGVDPYERMSTYAVRDASVRGAAAAYALEHLRIRADLKQEIASFIGWFPLRFLRLSCVFCVFSFCVFFLQVLKHDSPGVINCVFEWYR